MKHARGRWQRLGDAATTAALVYGATAATAMAHVEGAEPRPVAQTVLLALLILPPLLYAGGLARLWRQGIGRGISLARAWSFFAGSLLLALALLPPLDRWSAESFAAHMVQHELLMIGAAPLLVLGRPLPTFLWAFAPAARARIGAFTRSRAVAAPWRVLCHPLTAWLLHAAVLWIWHAPSLFRAALEDPVLHEWQHASFLLSALLFWSALFLAKSAAHRGAAVLYLFTTTVHTGVLGALITLASRPWYAPDVRQLATLDPLLDQQLGGLIMWIPGSMVYVVCGVLLLVQWVRGASEADLSAQRAGPTPST